MRQQLLEIFHRRHACHLFQADQALSRADLDYILEAGRLSPSSFGLEQWKFLVLTSAQDKQAMQEACFNQPQVGSASALVVILAKIAELHPDAPYLQALLAREYPGAAYAPALANYRGFYGAVDVPAWSVTQCHIAAANMMTAASAIGIDSCPIGGFVAEAVRQQLDIDPSRHEVALVLAFGVCADAPPTKQRLPLSDLVEHR
ncbi:MAG: NAD(P)H-dependent oxidoreductase [Betaproteobacteria bacterium]|nr:NAD(P)H-dependent oxidoreductase [Betaproteobacteria bacterium]